jgi:hypothetical protein
VTDIEDSGIVCVHTENGCNYRFSRNNNKLGYRLTKTVNGSYSLLYSIAEAMTAIDCFNFNYKENAKIDGFIFLINETKSLCPRGDYVLIQEIRRLISHRRKYRSEEALDITELFNEDEQKRYDQMMQRLSGKSP